MSGTIGKLNVFKSRPPAYTPPTGEITMGRNEFMIMFRATSTCAALYEAAVGNAGLARRAFDDMFDEALRHAPGGVWAFHISPKDRTRAKPAERIQRFANYNVLRFANQQNLATFFDVMQMLIKFDIEKITNRRAYITRLKTQAMNGQLYTQLINNIEPQSNFSTATLRIPRRPLPPEPAEAGKTPEVLAATRAELEKGKAWLISDVQGSPKVFIDTLTSVRRASQKLPQKFALGSNDQILRQAWQKLVPDAPTYRGWNNAASQQKYPSNIGGTALLNEVLAGMDRMWMPSRGQTLWYDLALYLYGAIVSAQPFTDGNKRAARLAYVLMLDKGEVPFKAPNKTLCGRLGDMI